MHSFIIAAMIAAIAMFLAATAFAAAWVYKDARQRGLQAGMWTLLVVLSCNFIGLILYLLVGRKKPLIVCGNCGGATAQGAFCSACGGKLAVQSEAAKTHKSLLITSAACLVLAFVFLGACIGAAFTGSGFMFQKQYSGYQATAGGYARKVADDSSGDTWKLSYSEASDGYTFKKTYNARSKAVTLSAEIGGTGRVNLLIIQNDTVIDETIGSGSYNYDMAAFDTGRITIKVVNIDAADFSAVFKMKTG